MAKQIVPATPPPVAAPPRSSGESPALAAVRAALERLPATEDPSALYEAALAGLRQLFGPAALAVLRADARGAWTVETTQGLPADLPYTWLDGVGGNPAAGDTVLEPGAFGPEVGAALAESGLRTVWRLQLTHDDARPGVVLLGFPDSAAPAPETFALAQVYIEQLSTLLMNAELRSQLRAQRTQLEAAEAVSEISAALNSHLGEPDVLQLIADRARELFNSDGVAINLLEPDGRSVRAAVVSGDSMEPLLDRVHTVETSLAARVTVTGEPAIWKASEGTAPAGNPPIRLALVHPLTGPFGPIGSIGVKAIDNTPTFSSADMRVLEQFARQAALAITNARMLERSRQEAHFQATFNGIIEALLSAHTDDEVQAQLVDTAARLIPCASCFFAVYSSDLSTASIRHACNRPSAPDMRGTWDPQISWPDLMDPILKGDLIYWANTDETAPTPSERTWRERRIDSAVLVPVLYRGWLLGVLGFLNIQHMPNWLPLTPDLLRHLAAQVASALTTARLYEETREHLAAVRRLSERVHALNNVSVQIQAARHADEVFAQTFAGLRSLGLHAVVTGTGENGDGLSVIAHSFTARETARVAAMGAQPLAPEHLPLSRIEAFETAIRTREIQFCDNILPALAACFPTTPPDVLQSLSEALGVTRGVIAPLIARDRLLGLLVILGSNLHPGDEAALAPLASQAAIALDKAALYDAMQAAYRFSESLIDSMSEGLAVVDTEGRHMLANRAFSAMVGYEQEELEGQLPPLPYWPGEEDTASRAELRKILSGAYPPGREVSVTLRRRDGTTFHAGLTPGEVHDERGRVTGILVVVRDLTEREQLEAEAAEAHAAREADRLKSELLSTVSHELRTPLAAIKGFTSTMLRYGDRLSAEEQKEFLHDIEDSSDRLAELVSNLLNMSRLEAALLSMEPEPLDLAPLVRDEATGFLPRLIGRKQQLGLSVPDQLPLVQADPRRVRQVISNLLDNAAKYTPKGGHIDIHAEEDGADVVIIIADSGPGIPPEHLDRIFEPFHRVDSGLTRTVGGTGLGLAITRRIVDAHGGRIEVQSAPGAGTTFTVRLPIIKPE
jgi:PAS domain S-box-containing protein